MAVRFATLIAQDRQVRVKWTIIKEGEHTTLVEVAEAWFGDDGEVIDLTAKSWRANQTNGSYLEHQLIREKWVH